MNAASSSPNELVGLTSSEASRRLSDAGPNEIRRQRAEPAWVILASQFKSPVIGLLIAACVVSAALGEVVDAVAIASIVVLNGFVGFFQEYRAEKAVLALRAMTAPRARVRRDGHQLMVPAAEVVVGDLLLLEAGDIVAADARLVEAHALMTNEAALTGESAAAEKRAEPLAGDAPLAERHDSVFMGTSVANGTGMAEVLGTGMQTELGKIATLLETAADAETPLQHRLAVVSRSLLYICLGIVAVTAVVGLLRGMGLLEVSLSAVSLAVAAVPEGLPAVVTIALAVGVQRMAAQHVLVRKLAAVETLGCATVICTDKTGTLTTGVMTVRELWGPNHNELLDAAAACSDAELAGDQRSGVGDPTEVAILTAAAERGIFRPELEQKRPRRAVTPFDSERKRMSIQREDGKLYVKGAVEVLLPLCSAGAVNAAEANTQMATRGLRVLAVAVGSRAAEENLTLLGLLGLADPPRTEAIEAVASARRAGIQTVMITGDHPATAQAIARELGILGPGILPADAVHARATPGDKLRIVRELKAKGAIVAMTGDGVNDAPALREAHIGVAMGKGGTEVTREASDMVLADDNFASIVAAVREGRGIFDNIQKTLVYLLAGNAGELAVMLGAALAGLPLPLLPLHLLWINLVTDGLPALALVVDPPEADVLARPPRGVQEPLLGRAEWTTVVVTGLLQAATTLSVFVWALRTRDLTEARNLAFSVIVFCELFRAFAARSARRTFWEVGAFTNMKLVGVVMISFLIQLGLHHIPATQTLFKLGRLSAADCTLAVLAGLVPVTLLELWKLVRRTRGRATTMAIGAAALLLTLLGSRPALAADPALNAFVTEVLAQNPGLKARTLERESVLRDASAAGLFPDPEVAIMVDRLPERMGGEMPMVRYQVSQMLPWPGKLGLMEDVLKRRADGKAALARAQQVDLVREAKRAYFMLALNAGLRQVNHASHDLLTTIAKSALARYGAGVGGHHEVVRAEVERNALDIEALDLEGDRVSTIAMLNALRNTAADLDFPDPPLPTTSADSRLPRIAELMRLAEARRSELSAMRAMQREESTMAALSRRERYPDFMTSVWYNQMLGAPGTAGVMVGATIPIFNVRRQNRRAEASDLRASSAGNDLAAMRAMIRFEVADALRRLDTANRTLDLIVNIAAPRAQQSFSSSLSGYSTATVDLVGVLEAWRALQSVERARVETLVARAVALADIEHAVAGPIQKASP